MDLVIDTNIFDCEGIANNSINITDILTNAGTKTLIMDGNNNFDCVALPEPSVPSIVIIIFNLKNIITFCSPFINICSFDFWE